MPNHKPCGVTPHFMQSNNSFCCLDRGWQGSKQIVSSFSQNDAYLLPKRSLSFTQTILIFSQNDPYLLPKRCLSFPKTILIFYQNDAYLLPKRCSPFYQTMLAFLPNDAFHFLNEPFHLSVALFWFRKVAPARQG